MDGEKIVQKMQNLLFSKLLLDSPVLSGNMKMNIKSNSEREIIIDAPFYDIGKWQETGMIIHTGQTIKGRTAYAEWVNRLGAFGTHNKSEGWVNRSILEVATIIANEIGAEIIYDI